MWLQFITAKRVFLISTVLLLSACSLANRSVDSLVLDNPQSATLTPRASTYQDLLSLPSPKGKIVAAIYNFRDQTGQYKPAPSSSFSTSVTQGATSMLMSAMTDSGWFIPLEREGLQNLLTERKIIRAAQSKPDVPANNQNTLPSLLSANIILEGGIIAYESNIRTGGEGLRYFGVGGSEQYREDQVTVNLRAIDVRTGRVAHSVMTTKKILSQEITSGVYRFIEFKELLEMEAGTTINEPSQLCVLSAIELALIHLIADGIEQGSWALDNADDLNDSTLTKYLGVEPKIGA